MADSYSAPRAAAAARYKRHQYGVVAVSVLVTTMAVLARYLDPGLCCVS